jgi:hypothetical protein
MSPASRLRATQPRLYFLSYTTTHRAYRPNNTMSSSSKL